VLVLNRAPPFVPAPRGAIRPEPLWIFGVERAFLRLNGLGFGSARPRERVPELLSVPENRPLGGRTRRPSGMVLDRERWSVYQLALAVPPGESAGGLVPAQAAPSTHAIAVATRALALRSSIFGLRADEATTICR
jgi:hypothetical protein